ncbi:MAG: glycerol-3-phosphate dehydrogenase/oxidase [Pyrinomonadaceae bacterium]
MNRSDSLRRVRDRQDPWDIVVIGGGATGVGCALDAASRGFDVLLLERDDFGKGTSSRSTKLIHGGVRYLAQGRISLVREALKERGILRRNAPHIIHKQAFIVPCYSFWQKAFYGAGLKIYDLLSGKYSFGKSQILSKSETRDQLPSIKTEGLSGGVLYYDGQFDDTRLLIGLAITAHDHGAAVLNYARVSAFQKDEKGRINGVEFEDVESGTINTVSAKCVINATGIFCDSIRNLAVAEAKPVVTYSQGIHLVFDRKFLLSDAALMIPKTSDGRVLFCIPWLGSLLVGTTDTPIDRPSQEPEALESEINFVLEAAGQYLAVKPMRKDILSVFAGIRPLVSSGRSHKTSAISRGHELFVEESRLITVTGGKWTTYRRMAEDAVDKAVESSDLELRKCITNNLAITGGDPSNEEARLHPDLAVTRNDVIRAVSEEMARTLEDVLARRTRALFLNARAAIEISPKVAEIMAEELGNDMEWMEREIDVFKKLAVSYTRPLA